MSKKTMAFFISYRVERLLIPIFSLVFLVYISAISTASLEVGFYQTSCQSDEAIVRRAVKSAVTQDPGFGAGLSRMHFHDCFVRGCDASILLDSTPGNPSEKEQPANGPSLRGMEVIDEAKFELELKCPGTVSCADILAFAARDSARELGMIDYSVPAGRRDGRVSVKDEPSQNLPQPVSKVEQLQEMFARKGLSLEDMVTLSGAHSIGVTQCSAFSDRLHSFNVTHPQDPSMDTFFASEMRNKCPLSSDNGGLNNNLKVPLDALTPSRLDNKYYRNLENQRGVLASDQALMTTPSTARLVKKFARYGGAWAPNFVDAMVRMGSVEVLTGSQGEIRRNCRIVNQ